MGDNGATLRGWVQALSLMIVGCVACFSPCQMPPMMPAHQPEIRTVRIGVFSLFKPSELMFRASSASDLVAEVGGRTYSFGRNSSPMVLHASGSQIEMQAEGTTTRGEILHVHTPGVNAAGFGAFWLEAPGKLRRMYYGRLEVQVRGEVLEAIVTMPLEIAVASVVQAESPAGAGIEALKAQAVAARSFLVARQAAHVDFDFCDTTHCQFLRSPPVAGSPGDTAARDTEGLVLTWRDEDGACNQTLAAMYARSCGGRTRTLREIGVTSKGYPYYSVHCVYCSHHPEIWQRAMPIDTKTGGRSGAQSMPLTEQERLVYNRIHGWGALPSSANSLPLSEGNAESGNQRQITGRGVGHGVGLCQLGAADMDRQGASFAAILAHYYPNTQLTAMSEP